MLNKPLTFLQIYFIGSEEINRVDPEHAFANRCDYNNFNSPKARHIDSKLDVPLNEHDKLLKFFESHMHKLQSNNHVIIINPDKIPAGEHVHRLIVGIMVDDHTAT